LELTTFSQSNSTVEGGRVTIQSLLSNKSTKYDIFYYGLSHLPEIGEHLMNLRPHFSSDIINMFSSKLFNEICIRNNKILGFVNISFF